MGFGYAKSRKIQLGSCWALVVGLCTLLLGCGTYRVGSSGYRGIGAYRAPSDYSSGIDSEPMAESELQAARGHLNRRSQYIPRAAFKLNWPVQTVRVNRGYRPADDANHYGMDLGGKRGNLILAAHEGVVIYAGNDFSGYGNMVLVEYDGEWATLYAHLNEFTVRENMIVNPGEPIGTMGATGKATGVHLHFELMHNHQPTDPLPMLTKAPIYTTKVTRKARRQSSKPRRSKHALN